MVASTFQHCSVFSREAGDDLGGSAWARRRFLVIELPLPWPKIGLDAKGLPPGVKALVPRLQELDPECGSFFVAPDAEYSVPDRLRIMEFDFGNMPLGVMARRDVLVPVELVAETLEALAARSSLPEGAIVDDRAYRDFMICTHGARDACCATFGFPLYRSLRALVKEHPNTRIWRASHFGGHRFAPTMYEFPAGRGWGFLDADIARTIVERSGDVERVRHHYRGWMAHAENGLQLLEREAFMREGWSWLEYTQEGRVLDRDEGGQAREVEIVASGPESDRVAYRGSIERNSQLSILGSCSADMMTVPRPRLAEVHRFPWEPIRGDEITAGAASLGEISSCARSPS